LLFTADRSPRAVSPRGAFAVEPSEQLGEPFEVVNVHTIP
jgi:hypothetical protein